MDVGPVSRDPEPPGWADFRVYQAWAGRQAAARGLLITQDVTLVATEEPGRFTLAPSRQREMAEGLEERRVRGRQEAGRAAEWCSHCHEPGHVISRCPEVGWLQPELTLAETRRKWLGGTIGLDEFLAAVNRADLAELDQLPRLRRPGRWWRRVLLRVIRAVAGPRRVV